MRCSSRMTRPENPWLRVSPDQYEGHMQHPAVAQQAMLSAEFARAVEIWRPRRLLVPGCATGLGLECLHGRAPERVTAVDLQLDFLKLVCLRHATALPTLEIVRADLENWRPESGAYDLVHCALILEYLNPEHFVARMARALAPGGVAVFLLQLPLEGQAPVTLTPFLEVRALEPILELLEPARLRDLALREGLEEVEEREVGLPSGKAFAVLSFRRRA